MKTLLAIVVLLISTAALAQDALHITTKRLPAAMDAHHVGATLLEGDIRNRHYILDEAEVLIGMPFEVATITRLSKWTIIPSGSASPTSTGAK
jgi:hypothetical protein